MRPRLIGGHARQLASHAPGFIRVGPLCAAPACRSWRLSVEQYHATIRTGILTEDDPMEPIDGCLVTKVYTAPTGTASNPHYHHRRDHARSQEVPLVLDRPSPLSHPISPHLLSPTFLFPYLLFPSSPSLPPCS
jgi:hypothetical protein